jgi:hypothetical protein
MLIFVSSTFRDLGPERAAVQDALRAGEAAPWGMEFFNSQGEWLNSDDASKVRLATSLSEARNLVNIR